jgi:hypothetical protein
MNMQKVMVRAHQIARQCEGDYGARLALGLRQAWVEARALLVGSEWRKNGMHRIYINNLTHLFGLELDHYKTGNIAAASLRGQRISNTQAAKIEGRLCTAKVWYDVATGKFHGQNLSADDFACIVESVKIVTKAA